MKIAPYNSNTMSPAEYWELKATRVALKPLVKPCKDCAVENGFYRELSDELSKQPRNIQVKASAAWFCHCNPNRACLGNIKHLGISLRELNGEPL